MNKEPATQLKIHVPKDLADDVMDFLYTLRGEWDWKKNCGYPKPEEDYKELVAVIKKFKQIVSD